MQHPRVIAFLFKWIYISLNFLTGSFGRLGFCFAVFSVCFAFWIQCHLYVVLSTVKHLLNHCLYRKKQCQEVFCEKVVLRNFTIFSEKHLCQSLSPATLLKKRLWHRCFLWIFWNFFEYLFLQNTSGGFFCRGAGCSDFVLPL